VYAVILWAIVANLILIRGERVSASDEWGPESGGLRMRAEVKEPVVRYETVSADLEILIDHELLGKVKCFTPQEKGSQIFLRVYDEEEGQSRQFYARLPASIDVDFDSLTDIVRIGKLEWCPFSNGWPNGDRVWGYVELFVPSGSDEYWSGILTSAPFELRLTAPPEDMNVFSFVIPTRLVLVKGPRFSFDSTSLDTIGVPSRRDFHLIGRTTCAGFESAGPISAKVNDNGQLELPFLPFLQMGHPLPGTHMFIDGETTVEIHAELYESLNIPEFHIGTHFYGPHRLLWKHTFRLTITKEELFAATPDDEGDFNYRTFLIPVRLHLGDRRHLSFTPADARPFELRLTEGKAIGYSVSVNGRNMGCHEGVPRSPLIELSKRSSCDSPAEVTLRMFQYEKGALGNAGDRNCGSTQTIWHSRCTVAGDSGTFDLKASDINKPIKSGWSRWRQCKIPRDLRLTGDGSIEFDTTDMMTVDFTPWAKSLWLLRITVDDNAPVVSSTQLRNPISTWHRESPTDSLIQVTFDIIVVDSNGIPVPERQRPLYSKTYLVRASEQPNRTPRERE